MTNRSISPARPALLPWAVLIAILAVLVGASVGIMADAPYNDDFAYLTSVRWLHEAGVLKFTNWQYMTLVTQTALGGLWTFFFGYSVHALRILTLVIWAVGTVALVQALRSDNWVKTLILLSAAALSPMALVLATSFMTDIYYWALIIVAMTLFASGLETDRRAVLIASWVVLFLAVFVRQVALPVAVAFVIADLLKNGFSRSVLVRSVLPLALIALAYALSVKLAAATIGLPRDFTDSTAAISHMLRDLMMLKLGALRPFFNACILTSVYVGLFFIPLFLAGLVGMIRLPYPRLTAAGTIALGALLFVCLALLVKQPLPSAGNLINLYGLGPRSDWRELGSSVPPVWWAVTVLASLSGAFLVTAILCEIASILLTGGWRALRGQWRPLMFLVAAVLGNAPLMVGYAAWFDRHLLALLAMLGIGCLSLLRFAPVSAPRTAVPVVPALLGILLSILLLHDFGAWQRATLQGYAALQAHGIAASQVDGGFEISNHVLHAAARADQPAPDVLHLEVRSRPCQVTDLETTRAGGAIAGIVPIERWLPIGPAAVSYRCGEFTGPDVPRAAAVAH
ncbi:hypothetical protein [Sphingobium nicotianae]|uniref:Glycosyltransferase RgtA/B/C/D-like domain-containing protein n=1 Tax=Sphingobium nicotianae TaxID=2782607 RepID=A0A9X1DH26_9SPHN|nr:hypothetical protein [Sphingobium nicotianae]MBT2189168.1 hypothetical protein [Sphingobium nicotianae]